MRSKFLNKRFSGLSSLALALALPAAALAADLTRVYDAPPPAPQVTSTSFINELRLGGFAHGVGTPERRGGIDLNAEILTQKIFRAQDPFWDYFVPRLHVGWTANFDNKTSMVYGGLTWNYDFTKSIFGEFSFGPSLNDGKTGSAFFTPFDRAKLGCHLLFRESVSLGYRITDNLSIMATADHISNGGLCDYNRGLNNYGLRVGYTF